MLAVPKAVRHTPPIRVSIRVIPHLLAISQKRRPARRLIVEVRVQAVVVARDELAVDGIGGVIRRGLVRVDEDAGLDFGLYGGWVAGEGCREGEEGAEAEDGEDGKHGGVSLRRLRRGGRW
jgi:hypothetical protein